MQSSPERPQVHGNVTTREVDEGLLVHDERSGKVHVLNRSAGTVFRLCDGTHARDQIAQQLAAQGGVDVSRTMADVDVLLADFERLGLLSSGDPARGTVILP